jgi:hypothetical protein
MHKALFCSAFLVLAACGADETNSSIDASRTTKVSGSAVNKSNGVTVSGPSSLTLTPISFADATGETSVMMEVGPCPFVSDEAIISSVRTNFEITRREVSNTLCRWAYNAGFSIEVTIEDVLSAKPAADRRYNTGVDTLSEPQDGPGKNAQILNDTAWDKPIPFAYSFEKDGKLVFMSYTGFKTDVGNMRVAANEIAGRMRGAPVIEPQRRQATEPFNACEVWTEQDLKTVFGAGETATILPGASSMSTCTWKIFEDGVSGQRTAGFNIYKAEVGTKQEYEYDSYKSYSDNGETHYQRTSTTQHGTFVHIVTPRPEGIVYVTVSAPEGNPAAVGKAWHNNLLSRMMP